MKSSTRFLLGAALVTGCASGSGPTAKGLNDPVAAPTPTDVMIAALRPAKLVPSDMIKKIDAAISTHFERNATHRSYVMTDKPLYQPGETIWFRADVRATGTLVGAPSTGLSMQLISPRGAQIAQKRIEAQNGVAQNDFELAADIDGGEYTLQLTADDGTIDTRKIIVNTYEAPRLKKTVEFVRKAYGEGDKVTAAIDVHRATGEAFGERQLTGVVTIDDVEIKRIAIQTDKDGHATAKFDLPGKIARGDGLLTILADDGGITESIQKRIPIVMKTLSVTMFPEGGDLIEGVPGRVYFMAKTPIGKPADIEGRVVDDRGQLVSELKSVHDGMGRFELEPSADRTYHVEIDKPVGIAQKFDLPAAKSGGCAVRSVDGGTTDQLRVAAICTTSRTVLVEAVLREKRIADGAVEVEAGKPTLIELPIDGAAQGAVRVTLFSSKEEPLAERLVYHGRGQDLKVAISADKKTYSPRDPVRLKIHTTDAAGRPVKADVGVAVVDDTVLSFADDKSGRILSHLYLEPELGATQADPIEEPNFYFSTKPDAALAMDALLGTRGYRHFEWAPVLNPPPPPPPPADYSAMEAGEGMAIPQAANAAPAGRPQLAPPLPAPPPAKDNMNGERRKVADFLVAGAGGKHKGMMKPEAPAPEPVAAAVDKPVQMIGRGRAMGKADRWHGNDNDGDRDEKQIAGWAPVRVFPVPEYTRGYEGPRTDFRETIYWNPSVKTSSDGNATVSFFASDAVTSFRATAEGVSAGGLPGAGDAVIQSKMPLSLDAHLPVEVTSGDEIRLPVTLTNETDRELDADLTAQFGAAFKLTNAPATHLHLAAGEKTSLFFPLQVVATDGDANVKLAVSTGGLSDELEKKIHVVPLGFPFEVSASGTAKQGAKAQHDFDLGGALPGSIRATVTMYPSPLAAMTTGMAGMIREPGGCFEQTSSTNYPNIMVLSYLGANDATDTALLQKTQGYLDHGYKLLTGYETPAKGYEWFGHTPGHEALTAYGLMEFADMQKVYDVDPKMVERTAEWLMSRRDGKGGFSRSQEALDSFGRATEATTNAYIMWALSEAKRTKGLDKELGVSRALGESTKDPYLLALAANTALLGGDTAAHAMIERLVAMQAKDGSFAGAKESITMSGGDSLTIEATSLAVLALIKASPSSEYEAQIRSATDWLNTKRSGYGEWGNTQATILGLKALTAYSEHARQMQAPGSATLVINGQDAGTIAFDKGRKDALVWDDLASKLQPGHNTIELRLDSQATLPYTIAVEYRAARPQSSAATKVSVATSLAKDHVKMGEGVKLHATITNLTKDGIPMTLARIGIPGGLVFQTWQLKELRDKGLIDFYETRPREVVLYWRALPPSAKKDVDIDLLAQVPGNYEAPATSAYLYYTAEAKAWTTPTKITIEK